MQMTWQGMLNQIKNAKTEVEHQPTPEPTITEQMQVVDEFTYLGSALILMMRLLSDCDWHFADFAQISGSRMESDLPLKLKVYKAVVM